MFSALPSMSEAELRVTLVLIRHTFGFHQKTFKLGLAKLAKETGLSINGAKEGARKAEERGTFKRTNPTAQTEAEWELIVETPSVGDVEPSVSDGEVHQSVGDSVEYKEKKETTKYMLAPLSIENAIYADQPVTSLPKGNEMLKVAEVIAKSFKKDYQLAVDILMAFQQTRGITFLYEEQKTHKSATNLLIKAGVKPEHVVAAVKYNLSKGLACASLYSIKSKAIELANPAPSEGPKKLAGGYVSPKQGL
jgi:hypothetical protein